VMVKSGKEEAREEYGIKKIEHWRAEKKAE
jgi:hypothetical protein